MAAHDLNQAYRYIHSATSLPEGGELSRMIDLARAGLDVSDGRKAGELPPPARRPRDRLWDLSGNLHCSIIGTCLSTADLRALLTKIGVPHARTMDEHALHVSAVVLAGRRDGGGKLINKLLDRRYEREIARLERVSDLEGVRAFWRDAVERGEITGAYWAVLTHPLTDYGLVKEVFGEVHMLSHLVGRAVRLDLRRLASLEELVAARDGTVAELEGRVRALTHDKIILAERVRAAERKSAPAPSLTVRQEASVENKLAQWRERLDRAEAHAAADADRRAIAEQTAADLTARLRLAEERAAALQEERDGLEAILAEYLDPTCHEAVAASLNGLCVLYLGGRPRQVAQARHLVRRWGGTLLTHDGGLEDAPSLLPGLIGRADLVLFPVDCVSHDAALAAKRLCREGGQRLVPLRSASIAALVAALTITAATPAPASER